MKPTKCPAKEKQRHTKSEKRGEKHAHARTSQAKIFCIWIRRPPSVQPVNGFMVNSCSLQSDSDQKTARLALNAFFGNISGGEWVNYKQLVESNSFESNS